MLHVTNMDMHRIYGKCINLSCHLFNRISSLSIIIIQKNLLAIKERKKESRRRNRCKTYKKRESERQWNIRDEYNWKRWVWWLTKHQVWAEINNQILPYAQKVPKIQRKIYKKKRFFILCILQSICAKRLIKFFYSFFFLFASKSVDFSPL